MDIIKISDDEVDRLNIILNDNLDLDSLDVFNLLLIRNPPRPSFRNSVSLSESISPPPSKYYL